MSGHRMTLGYTIDDDGIHLSCSCGWTKSLGYEPTPRDVDRASDAHIGKDTTWGSRRIGGGRTLTGPDDDSMRERHARLMAQQEDERAILEARAAGASLAFEVDMRIGAMLRGMPGVEVRASTGGWSAKRGDDDVWIEVR